MKSTRTYGMHLMIDGYGADPALLDDLGFVFKTLDELPGWIGMRKVGPPHVARFTEKGIAGVSGMVMIMESHISLHTYLVQRFFSMDVYSCKPFDHEKVAKLMGELLRTDDLDVQVVDRGKRFPG